MTTPVKESSIAIVTRPVASPTPRNHEKDVDFLLQLTRKLIAAHDLEKQKLSQEIHDEFGNRIALIALSVRQAMKQDRKNAKIREGELNRALEEINRLSTDLSDLSHRLYPPTLRYAGIRGGLRSLVDKFQSRNHIKIEIDVPSDTPRLPEDVQLCIFRIAQESLKNVVTHSGAQDARVALECTAANIRLAITDTGRGFVQSDVAQVGGLGLQIMKERAFNAGGTLTVNSSPRLGTEILLALPLRKEWTARPEG
jgi:signal transduction histidine kinase